MIGMSSPLFASRRTNKALKEKFKKLMASRILLRVSVSPRGTEVTDTIATL
jgi:hypothetical protein